MLRARSSPSRSSSDPAPVSIGALAVARAPLPEARPIPLPIARPEPAAAPVIKWVGGKTKLLPELLARMPVAHQRYYEPFCGGAALFFRLAPARGVLSDSNADLIGLYRTLASDVTGVIRHLESHRRLHDERHYYATRQRWNDHAAPWPQAERAAAFIYLNKTCFNGLWRVNRAGDFNVPIGRYTDPPICVPAALHAAHALLARTKLLQGDYRKAVEGAGRGDFVYFDPPYDPVTPTANFTSYTADAFGSDHQRELAETAGKLVDRGCQVMLSNSDTPFIRSLYKGWQIDRVKCARAINSNASRRGDVDEVIITGGYARRA